MNVGKCREGHLHAGKADMKLACAGDWALYRF